MKQNIRTARQQRRVDQGFTLVEILIAIVVVGILAAVAIVGINSLTSTGNKSACNASADAAKAASAAYFANHSAYPSSFGDMTKSGEYVLPSGVSGAGTTVGNGKWTLTMTGGTSTANTFTCS